MDRMQQDGGDTLSVPDVGRIALATLDALPARVCVIDETGRIIVTNKAWREFGEKIICGCPDCGSQPCPDSHWIMPCWSHKTADEVSQAVQDMQAGKRTSFSIEYECHASDAARSFATHIACLPDCSPAMLLMSHDDISERRRAEDAQHKSAKRLKRLGAHMESVREEQSAMIARELHDELGALLTMLKLDLALTADKAAATRDLRTRFDELLERVHSALQVVKRISTNLRPATLDTLGLMATIRWYLAQFSHLTGIETELQLPEYVRLSDVSNIAVFRIIQEGLTNVANHSGAKKVMVNVYKRQDELIVEIIDNGRGISEQDLQRQNSFGVIGMHERAQYLGGALSICGQPGEGTQLVLKIPLDD